MRPDEAPRPVYDGYFADPFVFRHESLWYAVGTGSRDETPPLLRSSDGQNWELVGSALADPLPNTEYWAPAVAHQGGVFYLYYSHGPRGEPRHELRVAIADRPEGPYRDHARLSPPDLEFAIDGEPYYHPETGEWFLFYARDFLDTERPGTSLVVDRLVDMTRLAGEERVVARAGHDWQRFRANRPMYGDVYDWHTLEGPAIVRRGRRLYLLYSGGNWKNESYGVDFLIADHPMGPWTGGSDLPRVLRSVPGLLRGPGHNSVVSRPEGDFIVFHAWDATGKKRQMYIEPLLWTTDGPSTEFGKGVK